MNARPLQLAPDWRVRGHAGWWAFALHRVSGIALTVFLPAHFIVLGKALTSEAALDGFLSWTDQPLVRASEIVLVFLLAAHTAGGLRLMFAELRAWRASWQPTVIAVVLGVALVCALSFGLNLLRS